MATATRNDFLLSILAVAFASALGFWSSRNLARPVRSMISAVRNYGDPGFEAALPVGRSDELGEFARAFRDLAAGLDSAKRSEHSAYVRLRAAIDQSVDGFVTIDAKGIILVCNSACERMLGLEPGEVLGRNVKHLMFDDVASHHDGYLLSAMLRHEDESSFPVREVTGRHKSGRPIPIELTVNRVDVHDGILFSAILRDISDRKRRDAERDRLLHELVVSNESLDEFAYIASHDLREPLRAIHNHSTFLAEDFGDELGEAGKNRIARLTYLAQRLDRLVEDLLYFSRLGRNQDARHPTPLGKIVDRVREDLRDHLDETNSTVEIVDELPTVECDSVRIGEVYRHLIVNAIRYNDSESPRVTIGFENGVLYVRDNGIGIAETFHDKIFRIFKRLHPIGTYGEGTGAGLTFVKRIIERHGGKIWIESEPGNGSTFHFTLQSENHENVQAEPTHTDRRG